MKLDIQKAFDTMSWDFIMAVLDSFGFSITFRNWIRAIFDSARISILLMARCLDFSNAQEGSDKVILCLRYFLGLPKTF